MRFGRLFTNIGALNQALCGANCFVGILCLLGGVFITALTLERTLLLEACLGATLLLGGIFLVELGRWFEKKNGGRGGGHDRGQMAVEATIEAAVAQALVILLFACLLDGGVWLQACLYSDFGYWVGALLVFARRRRTPTWGDLLYLRWGWLPIVVIGVSLFVRVWTAKRLI